MKKLTLLLLFFPLISIGQNQIIKKSYKEQIVSGDINKTETEYYDDSTGVYSNFKYLVSIKKPKGWEFDYGSGQYTLFRAYVQEMGYSMSLNVVESDLYPTNYDAHDLYDQVNENGISSFFKDNLIKQSYKVSEFKIDKTFINNLPTIKFEYTDIFREEDLEVPYTNILYMFIYNGNVISFGINIPQLFYNSDVSYYDNLFFINFLPNLELITTDEIDEKIYPFSHYWESGIKKEESGDNEGAIKEFSKAIDYYPNHRATPGTYYARGIVKNKLKFYNQAIDDFSKSIDLEYKQSPAVEEAIAISYNARGNSKGLKGDLQGACEDWKLAKGLGFEGIDNLIEKYCK